MVLSCYEGSSSVWPHIAHICYPYIPRWVEGQISIYLTVTVTNWKTHIRAFKNKSRLVVTFKRYKYYQRTFDSWEVYIGFSDSRNSSDNKYSSDSIDVNYCFDKSINTTKRKYNFCTPKFGYKTTTKQTIRAKSSCLCLQICSVFG